MQLRDAEEDDAPSEVWLDSSPLESEGYCGVRPTFLTIHLLKKFLVGLMKQEHLNDYISSLQKVSQ